MTKSNIFKSALVAAAFCSSLFFNSPTGYAQSDEATTRGVFPEPKESSGLEELKPHIGIQMGYAEPGEDYDGAAELGIEVGYQPYIPFGLALELTTFSSEGDADEGENDLDRTRLMVKGTYNFGGGLPIIRNSFVGLGTGPVFDDENGDDDTNIGFNFLAGVDFPLTANGLTERQSFSLGATVSYLTVIDAEDNFLLNGQMKYWF